MSRRAACATCGQDRWLDRHLSCRTCRQSRGACPQCGLTGRLVAHGLCYCCYQHRQVSACLDEIEASFAPKSAYNQQLFALYLQYVRRYRLQYFHKRQARKLKDLLECDALPTLRSWNDVYQLSKYHGLVQGRGSGCAVKKIGFMLQELGVLAAKDDDLRYLIVQALAGFRTEIKDQVGAFVAWLENSGRTEATAVNNLQHLKHFDLWLRVAHPEVRWQGVSEDQVSEHLSGLVAQGYRPSRTRDALLTIRRFYLWLKLNRQVLHNPAEKISTSGLRLKRLVVLSPSERSELIRFVQAEGTDPEAAMLIALILFFALKTEDLMHATVDTTGGTMGVALRRRRRSVGKHLLAAN